MLGMTRTEILRAFSAIGSGGAALSFATEPASASTSYIRGATALTGVGVIFDTKTGAFLSGEQLPRYLATALQARASEDGAMSPRVVFAAEQHEQRVHHTLQCELIKAVDAIDDAPTLIGLEMCWRQHQPALDAFVFADVARGGGDLELLAKRTAWSQTWGYPIDLYSSILHLARDRKMRLCGLNTPYPLVRAVANSGLSGLPPKLQRFLPTIDLTNVEHRRRFAEAMGGRLDIQSAALIPPDDESHGKMTEDAMQRSYEAMTLWDEFMAASVAGYVSAEPKPGAGVGGRTSSGRERMVVMAGSSHIRGRVGIPERFTRRTNLSTFTVLPISVPWPELGRPAKLERLPSTEADWIVYTKPQRPEGLSMLASRRLGRSIFM